MAFRPLQYDSGKLTKVECADAQTIVKGDALSNADGTGYFTTVSAGDGITPTHIAMETVTTTADAQKVLALRVEGVVFEADCDAAPAIAFQGAYIDLASKSTLDADASADDIFYVEEIKGAVGTSTKVIGWFKTDTPQT